MRFTLSIVFCIFLAACVQSTETIDLPPEQPVEHVQSPIIAPPLGKACGARTRNACESDEYCYFKAGTSCDHADRPGVCKPRPQMCTKEYRPVCGCDGITYSTACVAASKGMGVNTVGACKN